MFNRYRLDRPLGALEALSLRLHWLACGGCRRFRDQQQLMRQAMDRCTAQCQSCAAVGSAGGRVHRA
jgi:hypothetical protein